MAGFPPGMVIMRHSIADRGNDLYETPPEAVHALIRHVDLPRKIWEPACGPGAIVRVLRNAGHDVLATDLVNYDSPDQDDGERDFLLETQPTDRTIVTNPPFKIAAEFAAKAINLAPRVFLLLRLAFLESKRRTTILESGQFARVLVFRKRLPMMHRDGWAGPKISSSSVAYAWFEWSQTHHGPATIERISWEDK